MARRIGPAPRPRRDRPSSRPHGAEATDYAIGGDRTHPDLAHGRARPVLSDGLRRDVPRLAVAALSALVPGLGQLLNGRRRLAVALLIPSAILVAVALAVVLRTPRMRLIASLVAPSTLDTLLTLNVLLLGWRLFAVAHAFVDRRPRAVPSRWGIAGLLALGLFVAAPHALASYYGNAARDAFGSLFASSTPVRATTGGPAAVSLQAAPGPDERVNVLIMGIDATKSRAETLTDSMIVASLDPRLGTVSMVSIPRDLIDVPLGDGRTYGPKINSLYSYAMRDPTAFPKGPTRTVEDAVGALLGIRIDYYATADFAGFVQLVDLVGGVDVDVARPISDPTYDGWDGQARHCCGWSIGAGRQHLDGVQALAYARVRKPLGESDFTRAARQQQILVALKQKITAGGDLLFRLPSLLRTLGAMIRTDLPPGRLPDLAAIAEGSSGANVVRAVIQAPFVRPATRAPYGSVQIPDLAAIRQLAAHLFPPPGTEPIAWKPGRASPGPSPSRSPSPSP